ncbi:MAG: type II toxin-antitoxin system VapC family toxin [Calditrichaeota bacterium]|nr:MAG: type II toxin-antitoxin system VapC family toxin [Calditrichota bacterium]
MRILLDTNTYVAFQYGHPGVVECVARATGIDFSTVVAGELLHGFHKGGRFDENRQRLHDFLSRPEVNVLPVTLNTADRFGRIMAALRTKGCPIPVNDVWIAAHAFESGADLVTFDRHFEAVEGLALKLITL